jgi:hypothetical protein
LFSSESSLLRNSLSNGAATPKFYVRIEAAKGAESPPGGGRADRRGAASRDAASPARIPAHARHRPSGADQAGVADVEGEPAQCSLLREGQGSVLAQNATSGPAVASEPTGPVDSSGRRPATFDEVGDYAARDQNENEQRQKPRPPAVSCEQHINLRFWVRPITERPVTPVCT